MSPSKDELSEYHDTNHSRTSQKRYSPELSDNEDQELYNFTLNINSNRETKTKNKNAGIWKKPGENVQIGKFLINKGFFYLGGQLKSVNGYETEASLIDNTLNIEYKEFSYHEDLGYWPRYNQLSSTNKGTYIKWLASERNDISIPLGYVFLYFYGIERRILIDYEKGIVSNNECTALYTEIGRLRDVYGENKSVFKYTTQLLDYICIINKNIIPDEKSLLTENNHSLLFRYTLSNIVKSGESIPAKIALAWLYQCQEYSFRTPARRCREKFESLFIELYKYEFGEGLVVKENKTKFKMDFYPASNTLYGFNSVQIDLPEASILKAPVKKLMVLADSCTDELDAYSRYLGKKGTSKEDLIGLLLLPNNLFHIYKKTIVDDLYIWIKEKLISKNGLISLNELWTNLDMQVPEKINKKEIDFIINLTNKLGFGIAPDPRYHHAKPLLNGKIVLFDEGHGDFFKPSISFNEVGMKLRLGAMVANSDGFLDESESLLLKELIDHNIRLSPQEKQSLHAYLIWRLNTPSNITGVKARLETLNRDEKSTISHYLISIALSDGKITGEEIKQLEKLYVSLGLDKTAVTSDIHHVSSSRKINNSTKIILKTETNINSTIKNDKLNLNNELINIIESETHDVQKMLGEIFIEKDFLETEEDTTKDLENTPNTLIDFGLDVKHNEFYLHLLSREEWSRNEVQEICEKIGLMMDGAFDTINDWSFEQVDAAVINDEGNIYIDQEIVQEINELKG